MNADIMIENVEPARCKAMRMEAELKRDRFAQQRAAWECLKFFENTPANEADFRMRFAGMATDDVTAEVHIPLGNGGEGKVDLHPPGSTYIRWKLKRYELLGYTTAEASALANITPTAIERGGHGGGGCSFSPHGEASPFAALILIAAALLAAAWRVRRRKTD